MSIFDRRNSNLKYTILFLDFDTMDELSIILGAATLKKIKLFETIRGRYSNIPFWDVIVLTALDKEQQECYELQIKEKLKRSELPLSPAYHVFHDPPGAKVGNGGATLVVIEELEKIYQTRLNELKVLILHAGGYSQRLPSASMLGKIFTALPLGM